MVARKSEQFTGKNTDLAALQERIERYLTGDGFTVQSSQPSPGGVVIQAQKGGWLAKAVDADRALTVAIAGEPNDFTVTVGIGKLAQHLAVATIETLLISELFLPVDLAETAWNLEIESKLLKEIREFIG
jgi:hypothetical protein